MKTKPQIGTIRIGSKWEPKQDYARDFPHLKNAVIVVKDISSRTQDIICDFINKGDVKRNAQILKRNAQIHIVDFLAYFRLKSSITQLEASIEKIRNRF